MVSLTASLKATPSAPRAADQTEHVEAFVRDHYGFVWRVARRWGLSAEDADDATQRVFMTAVGRLTDIVPGSERAFLFRTAMHVVDKIRRTRRRKPETTEAQFDERAGDAPLADDLLDQRRARDLLDQVLNQLPDDLRAVLVLFEIEELTTTEIAAALTIPVGTVASRLRRARAELADRLARHRARFRFQGSPR